MHPGTGYASQNAPDIHFGLDDAAWIDSLEIYWPAGGVDRYVRVQPRVFLVGVEGASLIPDGRRSSRAEQDAITTLASGDLGGFLCGRGEATDSRAVSSYLRFGAINLVNDVPEDLDETQGR